MKIKILILIFVALTSQGWAQTDGEGLFGFLAPLIALVFIGIVILIFYRMVKKLLMVVVNKRNSSENRLENLQLLKVNDLIREEAYEN